MENQEEKKVWNQSKFLRMYLVSSVLLFILFFSFSIIKDGYYLHKYIVSFGFLSMGIGLYIGLNSNRIDEWITKMKIKFSKKKELPEIN